MGKIVSAMVCVLSLAAAASASEPIPASSSAPSGDPASAPGSAHQFTFTAIDGAPLPLASFAGKAVLVVNTASLCGFTRQYGDLQAVWDQFRDRGLVVLGVPSNDFGGQEPGSDEEIKTFCEVNFGVDFPLTSKERVKGEMAHPFYRWAAEQLGAEARPRWNFHKYLVAPDGRLVAWFPTSTSPRSGTLQTTIEAALPAAER